MKKQILCLTALLTLAGCTSKLTLPEQQTQVAISETPPPANFSLIGDVNAQVRHWNPEKGKDIAYADILEQARASQAEWVYVRESLVEKTYVFAPNITVRASLYKKTVR